MYCYICAMFLVDTHTHLYAKEFDHDRDAVMQRAFDNQIAYMILPNIDTESIGPLHQLCNQYPEHCFPMMGLHPTSVNDAFESALDTIRQTLDQRIYYAIGEIGIDLYWEQQFREQQEEAFRRQIEWAKEKALPIVIHARNSFNEIFTILDDLNDERLTGVFHCFTGDKQQAEKALSYDGFKLGVGGVLTFKNSGLDKTMKDIDLNHLILETDSPYLAPAPNRGKRNETAYLRLIAERLADVKGISVESVARETSENAIELFNLPVAQK